MTTTQIRMYYGKIRCLHMRMHAAEEYRTEINVWYVMVPITSSNQQQQSSYSGLNIFKVSNDISRSG